MQADGCLLSVRAATMGLTPLNPHDLLTPSFRMPYACLTRIDERGANLRDEALLGHKSLATTAPPHAR